MSEKTDLQPGEKVLDKARMMMNKIQESSLPIIFFIKIKIDKNVKIFMVNKMALFIHCFVKKEVSPQ